MTASNETKEKRGLFGALKGGMDRLSSQLQDSGSLQSNIRQGLVQYNPSQPQDTLKLQLAIKASAGVVRAEETLARELQLFSKNLFIWSKEEKGHDLVDVTDRLAFFMYKQGELQQQAATAQQQARSAIKDIRNYENEMVPRRKQRDALAAKLSALQTGSKHDSRANVENAARMQSDLDDANRELASFESSLEGLKRTKLNEAFSLWFASQRELGEKQAILASYGELLLAGQDSDGFGNDYKGHERTAQIKAQVGEKLQAWSSSSPLFPTPQLKNDGSSYLGRADTQSFGSTHAAELSSLHEDHHDAAPSSHSSAYNTSYAAYHPSSSHGGSHSLSHSAGSAVPARVLAPIPGGSTPGEGNTPGVSNTHGSDPFADSSVSSSSRPVPIPQQHAPQAGSSGSAGRLNLSPTPNDLGPSYSPSGSAYPVEPVDTAAMAALPSAGPTMAETGSPIVGTGGPISGQLPPRPNSSHSTSGVNVPGGFPSASEEKARLERDQVERANTRATTSTVGGLGGFTQAGTGEDLPTYTDGTGISERERAEAEAAQILAQERERKAGPSLT